MISAIILASGFSTRMKQEKLLLPVEGVPMILRVAQAIFESHVDERILVYRKNDIKQLVCHYMTKSVHNPYASRGQSEAIKKGLYHIARTSECCLFIMGDQPLINAATINEIIELWKANPDKIIVPLYGESPGSPVLFPSRHYPTLMKLKGDRGGREVIKKYEDDVIFKDINDEKAGLDADTHAAYISLVSDQHGNKHQNNK